MTRKLDALVAERIFERDPLLGRHGLHESGEIEYHWGYPVGHDVAPNYSSGIEAAWLIVERMRQKPTRPGGYMDDSWISCFIEAVEEYDYDCTFIEQWSTANGGNGRDLGAAGLKEPMTSVQLSICIAALRAVGVTENEISAAMEAESEVVDK